MSDESQLDINTSFEHAIAYTSKHRKDVQIKWCTTNDRHMQLISARNQKKN